MTSQDVIHSFFVPAFRVKQDVLPGRYTSTWFEATKTGDYHLFCTQYCGLEHAEMRGHVVVMSPEDFSKWQSSGSTGLAEAPGGSTMSSAGQKLFVTLGCVSCHGTGSPVRAPSLFGLYGTQVGLSDGRTVLADENYLRESILYPSAKIVMGYPAVMPSFQGVVSESQLNELVAFLKSLRAEEGVGRGPGA
jgi:cytochrome c oxidase subunit 2